MNIRTGGDAHREAQLAAAEDQESVTALARDLVRVPSRGGADAYEPVLDLMQSWLADRGLPCRRLAGPDGDVVALACEISTGPGPRYVLDACLDTAPFGDETAWSRPPLSGDIDGGWLYGRGSADSKAGAAVFAHVAARLAARPGDWTGSVTLLFDVDEHTGGFGGAKAYFEGPGAQPADGVMIGYPGREHVVTGGRGCFRARALVRGISGHSGSSRPGPVSAASKAAELVTRLDHAALPGPVPGFPLPAKLTVTALSGGEGFSVVPDLVSVSIDVRLTPALDSTGAEALIRSAAAETDAAWPGTPATGLDVVTCWPPFALPGDSPLRAALLAAAAASGLSPSAKIAGPSNIGNYLAGLGIPATAGFGVAHEGLHAANERVRLDSVQLVQATYHQALLTLTGRPDSNNPAT
jgi:succinyl-diaminopimelate desuccinylase